MTQTAILAGGCFWCTEAIFSQLQGVIEVIPGYSGGNIANPSYEQFSSRESGHAEVVQITFDPDIISFKDLLDVFFKLHDPTTLNCQGADVGSQYRSSIFYHDQSQKNTAEKVKQLAQKNYASPIVTEIVAYKNFYPAEAYHKDFYFKNRQPTYCTLVIDPKIQKLKKEFPKYLKA